MTLIQEQADRYSADIKRTLKPVQSYPERREAVRRIATSVLGCGERNSMMQVLGRHPKWRWASLAAFLPDVRGRGDDRNDRALSFVLFRFIVQMGRWFGVQRELPVVLEIHEHAIARLFQRLNVLSPAAVREEMHDAMCLAIPLQCAAWRLGLCQVALPTQSGAFLCSVGPDGKLTAKTWIERPEPTHRHGRLIAAIEDCYGACAAELEVAQELAGLPIEAELVDFPVSEMLLEALERFDWLKDEYVPRPDPVGETWRQARAAAAGF
jgi:hypothetical protein